MLQVCRVLHSILPLPLPMGPFKMVNGFVATFVLLVTCHQKVKLKTKCQQQIDFESFQSLEMREKRSKSF